MNNSKNTKSATKCPTCTLLRTLLCTLPPRTAFGVLTELAKYVLISVQKEVHMSQAITYTEARQNLAETMNRVCDHHEPVIITRQKSPSVVLMSLEDYNAIMETAYLLRSPANAARLREALHAADASKTVQHDLKD